MKKVFEINAKEAMNNDYRERHAEERKMHSYFNLDNYRIFIRGYEVGSFYELPFVAFERVNDVYYPYIDCEFKDVNGGYHNYKSLYDGGKVTFYERKTEDTEDAELTLAHGITYRKPAEDLEDLEETEETEETGSYPLFATVMKYRPLKKRYTKAAVDAAINELNANTIYNAERVIKTGCSNYEKILEICRLANALQNPLLSFPLVCGIENMAELVR